MAFIVERALARTNDIDRARPDPRPARVVARKPPGLAGMGDKRRTGRIAYDGLATERVHPRSSALDRLSALGIARLMNRVDRDAVSAVGRAAAPIGRAVERIAEALSQGGRLFFVGAGTSGRLGVIEAAECPPTFGTRPSLVQAVIAGGRRAVFRSAEGAEDNGPEGARQIRRRARTGDVIVGIAASGVTAFVAGALREARRRGAATVLVTCNPGVGAARRRHRDPRSPSARRSWPGPPGSKRARRPSSR